MKNKRRKQEDWTELIRNHFTDCCIAEGEFEEMARGLRKGGDIEHALDRFSETLRHIRRGAEELHNALRGSPIRMMLSTNRLNLTEVQYHLLRAAGVELPTGKELGISPVTDYELYRMCIYEDESGICFMHPNEKPPAEVVKDSNGSFAIRPRMAISPEETAIEHYRPEQETFFAENRPDVLARARKNEQRGSQHAETS